MPKQNEYDSLITALELDQIVLLNLKQSRTEKIEFPLKIDTNLDVNKGVLDNNKITANIHFVFIASSEQQEEAIPQVEIEMTWQVTYRFEAAPEVNFSQDTVDAFIERNVPINIWPFVREAVSYLTTKMSLPTYLLPLLKVKR